MINRWSLQQQPWCWGRAKEDGCQWLGQSYNQHIQLLKVSDVSGEVPRAPARLVGRGWHWAFHSKWVAGPIVAASCNLCLMLLFVYPALTPFLLQSDQSHQLASALVELRCPVRCHLTVTWSIHHHLRSKLSIFSHVSGFELQCSSGAGIGFCRKTPVVQSLQAAQPVPQPQHAVEFNDTALLHQSFVNPQLLGATSWGFSGKIRRSTSLDFGHFAHHRCRREPFSKGEIQGLPTMWGPPVMFVGLDSPQ